VTDRLPTNIRQGCFPESVTSQLSFITWAPVFQGFPVFRFPVPDRNEPVEGFGYHVFRIARCTGNGSLVRIRSGVSAKMNLFERNGDELTFNSGVHVSTEVKSSPDALKFWVWFWLLQKDF
jgi:hypothetical protein